MLRSPRLGRYPFVCSVIFTVCLGSTLVACKKPGDDASKAAEAVELSLGAEDILQLGTADHGTGPVISGSLQPELRADLRAEVSAMVVKVHKENGEPVRKGDLLVTLDSAVLRDNLNSAEESLRAAAQSLDGAERQYQRIKSLQAQGMVSMQGLEESELKRNSAQSEFVASKARAAAAKQQLERTEVRAPFTGVVSARKASAGDTAQIGKELIQVIDPSSMRFEGQVSADQMGVLKVGQRVNFRINGVAQSGDQLANRGIVKRIDGAAKPLLTTHWPKRVSLSPSWMLRFTILSPSKAHAKTLSPSRRKLLSEIITAAWVLVSTTPSAYKPTTGGRSLLLISTMTET